MTITQEFFISVMQAVDNNFSCNLMTSDDRLINTIKQLNDTRIYDYYSDISLSTENKDALISHVLAFNSERHISRFEIFNDNHLVFISYNGFEKGVISSIIPLSEDFIDKFVKTKMCRVTDKMTITQNFFIDVLNLINEENLYCESQSSDDNLIKAIQRFDKAVVIGNYSAYFTLNDDSKKILIDTVVQYHSEENMAYFEIKKEGIPLFLAYDGFEIAEIAGDFQFSDRFIEEYIRTDLCIVWKKIIYLNDQLKYNIQPVRIKM